MPWDSSIYAISPSPRCPGAQSPKAKSPQTPGGGADGTKEAPQILSPSRNRCTHHSIHTCQPDTPSPRGRNSAEPPLSILGVPHHLALGPRLCEQPGGKTQPAPVHLGLTSWAGKQEIKLCCAGKIWKNKFPHPVCDGDIPTVLRTWTCKSCRLVFSPSLSK